MLNNVFGRNLFESWKKIKDNEINFDGKLPRYKLYLSNVKRWCVR